MTMVLYMSALNGVLSVSGSGVTNIAYDQINDKCISVVVTI